MSISTPVINTTLKITYFQQSTHTTQKMYTLIAIGETLNRECPEHTHRQAQITNQMHGNRSTTEVVTIYVILNAKNVPFQSVI